MGEALGSLQMRKNFLSVPTPSWKFSLQHTHAQSLAWESKVGGAMTFESSSLVFPFSYLESSTGSAARLGREVCVWDPCMHVRARAHAHRGTHNSHETLQSPFPLPSVLPGPCIPCHVHVSLSPKEGDLPLEL